MIIIWFKTEQSHLQTVVVYLSLALLCFLIYIARLHLYIACVLPDNDC